MPASRHTLFIPKSSIRAGAQTSLARLLGCDMMNELNPAVLVGGEGWLSSHLQNSGIPLVVTAFPRLRRLTTRIIGLKPFVKKSTKALDRAGIRPKVLVANDHTECPLALELSRHYGGIPVLGILRSSGMTQRDFDKFRCNSCDELLIVGDELRKKVKTWAQRNVGLFEEGFTHQELHPMRSWQQEFPQKLLVIGSEKAGKGFADFIHAVDLLETAFPDFPELQCDFTGTGIEDEEGLLMKPRRAQFRFLGRVENFTGLVRQYPLAIHPSRAETFGLAPLEAILAGVPTLASVTGAIDSLNFPEGWTFPPNHPVALASCLEKLWKEWPSDDASFHQLQLKILDKFHIDRTVIAACEVLKTLAARSQPEKRHFRFAVPRLKLARER